MNVCKNHGRSDSQWILGCFCTHVMVSKSLGVEFSHGQMVVGFEAR